MIKQREIILLANHNTTGRVQVRSVARRYLRTHFGFLRAAAKLQTVQTNALSGGTRAPVCRTRTNKSQSQIIAQRHLLLFAQSEIQWIIFD